MFSNQNLEKQNVVKLTVKWFNFSKSCETGMTLDPVTLITIVSDIEYILDNYDKNPDFNHLSVINLWAICANLKDQLN